MRRAVNTENIFYDCPRTAAGPLYLANRRGWSICTWSRGPPPRAIRCPPRLANGRLRRRRRTGRRCQEDVLVRPPMKYGALLSALVLGAMRGHGAWGVAYAPADTGSAHPPIVYMHGMWASPEDSCATFESAATPFGFLVCPRGNAPLGEGRMWSGTYASVAPQVHAALDAADALAPGKLDRSSNGTLMGFSNGAYFAVDRLGLLGAGSMDGAGAHLDEARARRRASSNGGKVRIAAFWPRANAMGRTAR